MDDPRLDDPPLAVPAPGRPEPLEAAPAARRLDFIPGFAILAACLEAGEWFRQTFELILPGSILGLFLLLALLGTGLVPLRWVESAARLLLWLLAFLFLPIFILAMRDRTFWAVQGSALCGAVVLGTVFLWALVGLVSQWIFHRTDKSPRP